MNSIERKTRISLLSAEIGSLQEKVYALQDERLALRLEQDKEDHPCTCVKLNKDIEIYDMMEQELRGREPLSLGSFVCDLLTALKNCPVCRGTGIPIKDK
jgi:hypothetical protein